MTPEQHGERPTRDWSPGRASSEDRERKPPAAVGPGCTCDCHDNETAFYHRTQDGRVVCSRCLHPTPFAIRPAAPAASPTRTRRAPGELL